MTATLLDGRLVSDLLLKEVNHKVSALKKKKIAPKLVIILVGDSPASLSYIRQKSNAALKTGIVCEVKNLPASTTTKNLIGLIEKLNKDKKHWILVQLPLPPKIETPLVIRAIDPKKTLMVLMLIISGKCFCLKNLRNLRRVRRLESLNFLNIIRFRLPAKCYYCRSQQYRG